jgi:hypothetical protein
MTNTEFGRQATAKVLHAVASSEIKRMSDAPARLLAGYYAITSKYGQQLKENKNA